MWDLIFLCSALGTLGFLFTYPWNLKRLLSKYNWEVSGCVFHPSLWESSEPLKQQIREKSFINSSSPICSTLSLEHACMLGHLHLSSELIFSSVISISWWYHSRLWDMSFVLSFRSLMCMSLFFCWIFKFKKSDGFFVSNSRKSFLVLYLYILESS